MSVFTQAERDELGTRWAGFATLVANRVPRPPGATRDEWRAAALLGLAEGIEAWRPNPRGDRLPVTSAGFARFFEQAIRWRLGRERRALSTGRERGARENLSMDAPMGECAETYHDQVPSSTAPDPQGGLALMALEQEATTWPERERVMLGALLAEVPMGETARQLGVSRVTATALAERVREKVTRAGVLEAA